MKLLYQTIIIISLLSLMLMPVVLEGQTYLGKMPPTAAFRNISDGTVNITAFSYADLLTFTEGTNMTLTFFPANNTIRFASQGGGAGGINDIHNIGNVTNEGCTLNEILAVNSTGFWVCATNSGGGVPNNQNGTQIETYLVFQDGATTHAKSGSTGLIEFSSTTDDESVIQYALDNIGTGGIVHVKAGTYNLDDSLDITLANTVLQGDGIGSTIFVLDDAINLELIEINNIRNITILDLTLDGNSPNQSTNNADGISSFRGEHLQFHSLEIKNVYDTGIELNDAEDILITNCVIRDFPSTAGANHGIASLNTADSIIVNGCRIENLAGWGIATNDFAGNSNKTIITNNIIRNMAFEGINVAGGYHHIISNNVVSTTGDACITMTRASGGTIIGNSVEYCEHMGIIVGQAGIEVSNNTRVIGNHILNINTGDADWSGMAQAGFNNLYLGNQVQDTRTPPLTRHGLLIEDGNNIQVAFNDFGDFTGQMIFDLGGNAVNLEVFGNFPNTFDNRVQGNINMTEHNISDVDQIQFRNAADTSYNLLLGNGDNLDYILASGEGLLSIRPDRTVFNRDAQVPINFQMQTDENRTGLPVANINFFGVDDVGAGVQYGRLTAIVRDSAAGTGSIRLDALEAGTLEAYIEAHGGGQNIRLYRNTDLQGNNLDNFGQLQANARGDVISFSPGDTHERIESPAENQLAFYSFNTVSLVMSASANQFAKPINVQPGSAISFRGSADLGEAIRSDANSELNLYLNALEEYSFNSTHFDLNGNICVGCAAGGGDNLGDHVATQNLEMNTQSINFTGGSNDTRADITLGEFGEISWTDGPTGNQTFLYGDANELFMEFPNIGFTTGFRGYEMFTTSEGGIISLGFDGFGHGDSGQNAVLYLQGDQAGSPSVARMETNTNSGDDTTEDYAFEFVSRRSGGLTQEKNPFVFCNGPCITGDQLFKIHRQNVTVNTNFTVAISDTLEYTFNATHLDLQGNDCVGCAPDIKAGNVATITDGGSSTVTFNTAFATTPNVVATFTDIQGATDLIELSAISSTAFTININKGHGGANHDHSVDWIATTAGDP